MAKRKDFYRIYSMISKERFSLAHLLRAIILISEHVGGDAIPWDPWFIWQQCVCQCLCHRQCLCLHAISRAACEGCLSWEDSKRRKTYLQNKLFNLFAKEALQGGCREDSPYYLSLNTVFLSTKLMRQSHHADILPQAPRCLLGTTVSMHARLYHQGYRAKAFPAWEQQKLA